MIERKRRNDFVRKREFDMLRKVRREASRPSSWRRWAAPPSWTTPRGQDLGGRERRQAGRRRQGQDRRDRAADGGRRLRRPSRLPAAAPSSSTRPRSRRRWAAMRRASRCRSTARARRPTPGGRADAGRRGDGRGLSPLSPLTLDANTGDFGNAFAVEVSEVAHDPELDEAVIAFANADFEQCEGRWPPSPARAGSATPTPKPGWCCSTSTAPSASSTSSRAWRWTTPSSSAGRRRSGSRCRARWPRPPPRSARRATAGSTASRLDLPEYVDADAVARLSSQSLQMPLPWVFDWGRCAAWTSRPPRACRSCSAAGSARSWTCAGWAARSCSRCCRRPRRPACAMPIRPTGSCAWTRCA